jgi:hypothetical protein
MSLTRLTCDTSVVIDALEGTRPAAVELFARVRSGQLDVAFATRLQYELQRHTMDEVRALIGTLPMTLPTTARYGVSTYGGGDTYATELASSGPNLIPTTWRLDAAQLGVDTVLGGDAADVSNPTMDTVGWCARQRSSRSPPPFRSGPFRHK